MARRRKGTSAGHVGGAIVGAIILAIAAIPKEMWIALAIAGLIALIVWLVSKSKQTTTEPATEHSAEEETAHFEEAPRRTIQRSQPQKPKGRGVPSRWVSASETIEVAGTTIAGGMLYFGSDLRARSGDIEPALIDPRQPVGGKGSHPAALMAISLPLIRSTPSCRYYIAIGTLIGLQ